MAVEARAVMMRDAVVDFMMNDSKLLASDTIEAPLAEKDEMNEGGQFGEPKKGARLGYTGMMSRVLSLSWMPYVFGSSH